MQKGAADPVGAVQVEAATSQGADGIGIRRIVAAPDVSQLEQVAYIRRDFQKDANERGIVPSHQLVQEL